MNAPAWRGALAAFVTPGDVERSGRGAPRRVQRWLPAVRRADRPLPAPRSRAGDVVLRTAAAEDLPALQAFVAALSPTSRALRFFTPRKDLPPFLARALAGGDPRHRFVVAVNAGAPRSPIVALGQYARLAMRPAGELALVVGDAWQGRGLGACLLQRLLDDAAAAGLAEMEAEVLPENRAMLALARRFGFAVDTHPDDPRLMRILRSLEPATVPLPRAPAVPAALRPAPAACRAELGAAG